MAKGKRKNENNPPEKVRKVRAPKDLSSSKPSSADAKTADDAKERRRLAAEEKERKRLEREKEREEKRKAKEEERQRRKEEKQRLTEEAAKELENRQRHISTHRFKFLSGSDKMTQLSAYRGNLDDEVDPLFNKLMYKMGLSSAEDISNGGVSFGDTRPGDIATVNAALEQIKSFESSVAKLLEAGISPEGLTESGVNRSAIEKINSIKPGRGRRNLGRFVREGGIRDEIISSTSFDKPHTFTEFMKGNADTAKENLARYKDSQDASKIIQKEQADESREQQKQEKASVSALVERRRNLAAELKDQGKNEDAAKAMRGDYDETLSTEAAWNKYSDAESTIRRGAQVDEKVRQDEEKRRREEEEARAKAEQKQRQDWLNERRRNLEAELKSRGRNKDAAGAKLGLYDQFIIERARSGQDTYSDRQYLLEHGKKADRAKEEEERRKRELEEENELNKKRSLYADIKSYEAEAAGGRMSAVERLGIVTGASGRDTEFSDKSVSDLELLLAKAKDKAAEADTSGSSEEKMEQMEQIRSMRRLIKLVTGINVSSGQMRMWMGRMKTAGIDVSSIMKIAGPLSRAVMAGIVYAKAANATHEEARKASGILTERKWTAEQMGISKEDIMREDIAARRYGITGEDLLKSRSKVAQGIAQLKTQNDNSFFKPLWQAGFSTQNVNTVEDFENRLTEFLNNPNKTQEQKISVMRTLGRSEKEYEYAKNRDMAMSQVSNRDVQQAVIADEKQQRLAEARNKVEADYEAKKTQISASDSAVPLKWLMHSGNWIQKFMRNTGMYYDEDRKKVYTSNPYLTGNYMFTSNENKEKIRKGLEFFHEPPSIADVEKATAEVSGAAQGSQTQETNNNTTVNATYNITGSKQDAEAIRNAVDDANNKLAADINNSSVNQEIGGR